MPGGLSSDSTRVGPGIPACDTTAYRATGDPDYCSGRIPTSGGTS
jgi:hypothetical protein